LRSRPGPRQGPKSLRRSTEVLDGSAPPVPAGATRSRSGRCAGRPGGFDPGSEGGAGRWATAALGSVRHMAVGVAVEVDGSGPVCAQVPNGRGPSPRAGVRVGRPCAPSP
jgi:hypothetical protein